MMEGQRQGLLPPADSGGEIGKLREELHNERDRHMRTLADFDNYRRRIERDGNKIGEEGKRAILLSLLDIVDDMEKALHYINVQRARHSDGGLVTSVPSASGQKRQTPFFPAQPAFVE